MFTDSTELELIRKTVNRFIDGITKGDIELLRSAFHPKAVMYGDGVGDGDAVGIDGFYTYVASQQAPAIRREQRRYLITHIDLDGMAASVEVVQENGHGANYISYFRLLKIGREWLIVSDAILASTNINSGNSAKSRER